MLTWTFVIPWARSLWITCRVIPMFRIRIFIAGSEFLCSRNSVRPCLAHTSAACPIASMNHAHESAYGVWNG